MVYGLEPMARQSSFRLDVPGLRPSLAVDPSGSVYVAGDGGLYKFSPEGALVWARPASGVSGAGVFGQATRGGFRVGVVVVRADSSTGSDLFDMDGDLVGRSAVVGRHISVDPLDGEVVSTDGHFIRLYNRGGALVSTFGSSLDDNANGPFHLRVMGGATRAPDGTIYVTSAGNGMVAFTDEGLYVGLASDEGPIGTMTQGAPMEQLGGRIYYATGRPFSRSQGVSWVTPDELRALVDSNRSVTPRLGVGAGIETAAPGGYFPAGRAPAVMITFEPWWAAVAGELKGEYTVRTHGQVLRGEMPKPTRFAVPRTGTDMAVQLDLPPPGPGYYEVQARLLKAGNVVGADCGYYSIGTPADTLDFSTLPPGMDFGGPSPARSVAVAHALGFNLVRATLDWQAMLSGSSSSAPLDFSAADARIKEAARLAAANGVTLDVLLGGNGPEKTLVDDGTWGARVREVVEHFKDDVAVWEAWNEPNNTLGPADRYVDRVLRPVFESVRAADPGARVVGGSVLEMDLTYWDAIGRAGGFALMDVAGIHPYTGHNRSFEEQGIPELLGRFAALLGSHGVPAMPVWDTESAWWSDGPANYFSQADKLVRAQVLLRQAGVEKWSYFITEGGYGDFGLSYSLIQTPTARAASAVKPAALAAMTYGSMVAGRALVRMVETGDPLVLAAQFGARPGAPSIDGVIVVWADDVRTALRARSGVPVDLVDVMGAPLGGWPAGGQVTMTVDGSPRYLRFAGGTPPELRAVEAFGPDVAAAVAGARATASSELPSNPAAAAIDGVADAQGKGDFRALSAWAQAPDDPAPSITVALGSPTTVDRVVVSTHSLGSVVPGLRSYDISVRDGGGRWTTVGRVRDEFRERRRVVAFTARTVTEIRVDRVVVNYGGYFGGARPAFWPQDAGTLADPTQPWYGPAMVYEVAAYAPARSLGP